MVGFTSWVISLNIVVIELDFQEIFSEENDFEGFPSRWHLLVSHNVDKHEKLYQQWTGFLKFPLFGKLSLLKMEAKLFQQIFFLSYVTFNKLQL